jgi:hypothetical protein
MVLMLFGKKEEPKKVFNPLVQMDFKKDLEFLLFLIETEIATYKYTFSITGKKIMTDNDCIEGIKAITNSVIIQVSDNYRNEIISKYIKKEEVDNFIVKIITKQLANFGLELNKKTL